MDYAEKRDFQRMVLDCSMEFQLAADTKSYEGKVINLSATGVLFVTKEQVQAGESVMIKLTPVHSITPPMSADVLVIRCDLQSEDEYQIAAEIVKIF